MKATSTEPPPCPNPDCPAPQVVRNGTLKGRRRYHCEGCGTWFGEADNTPIYRLRTPPEDVGRALLVVISSAALK
jgi:transposase-like protein